MPLNSKPMHFSGDAYAKLSSFPLLEAEFNITLNACGKCTSDAGVQIEFDTQCGTRTLVGEVEHLDSSEVLGHVKEEDITLSYIASELKLELDDVRREFNCLCGGGSADDRRSARDWFETAFDVTSGHRLRIAKVPAWLFRPATPADDPFAVDVEDLAWRLALPGVATARGADSGRARYWIGFRVPATLARPLRIPTPFDAGYEGLATYWVPGGETKPHAYGPVSAISAGGLKEVVTEPPLYGTISADFVRFKNRSVP